MTYSSTPQRGRFVTYTAKVLNQVSPLTQEIWHARLGRFAVAGLVTVSLCAFAQVVPPSMDDDGVALAPAPVAAPLTQALAAAYSHNLAKNMTQPATVLSAQAGLPPLVFERAVALKKGESFPTACLNLGFTAQQAQALQKSLGSLPAKVGTSGDLAVTYTEGTPYSIQAATLTFRPQPDTEARLSLSNSSQVAVNLSKKPLVQTQAVAVGRITNSLYADATEAGMTPQMVKQFMDMFQWDIDYTRDIHPGDTFKVTYNQTVTDRGEAVHDEAHPSKIVAAAFTVGGQTRQAFFYNGEYLNENGESKKKLLLRTPLEVYHITSGFGMRLHPVLGFSRMHKGTDFAAPLGTPVKASGNGVVTFEGWHGGHGNYLMVKHTPVFTTAYAHLSKYALGIKVGSKVSQGQIIAYVGSTGMSTGPHLHYEVIKNNEFVDAMRTDLPTGTMLAVADKRKFINMVSGIQTAWNKALGRTQLASR